MHAHLNIHASLGNLSLSNYHVSYLKNTEFAWNICKLLNMVKFVTCDE